MTYFKFFCRFCISPWSLTSGKNFMVIHPVVQGAVLHPPSPIYLKAYVKPFTFKPLSFSKTLKLQSSEICILGTQVYPRIFSYRHGCIATDVFLDVAVFELLFCRQLLCNEWCIIFLQSRITATVCACVRVCVCLRRSEILACGAVHYTCHTFRNPEDYELTNNYFME